MISVVERLMILSLLTNTAIPYIEDIFVIFVESNSLRNQIEIVMSAITLEKSHTNVNFAASHFSVVMILNITEQPATPIFSLLTATSVE